MKSNQFFSKAFILSISFLVLGAVAMAKVELPKVLSSNMVLQRNQEVKVWGWADVGEKVKVTFNGQSKSAKTASNGKWMVTLEPMQAGGPFDMTIKGKNTIILENILIGDVWVCSGQSNMEWSLANTNNAEEEMAAANYPEIRIFDVPRNIQVAPVEDLPSGEWRECSPAAVQNFSAVGYFFGRELHKELNVPIGLIGSNWGGTVIETWMSRETAVKDPEMKKKVEEIAGLDPENVEKQMKEKKQQIIDKLGKLQNGTVNGKALWADENLDVSDWQEMKVPGLWEEQGLTGVDGVVWYRRTFELTKEQAAKDIVLKLGPIDDSDKTWVNGVLIDSTINKYNLPRNYRVNSSVLKAGTNTIVVRIEDYSGGGGMYGAAKQMVATTCEGDIPLAGDWKYRVSATDFKISIAAAMSPNSNPTLLYNGMINPLINYAVQGAIWYQGESNASRAYRYRQLFPDMINDWRTKWNNLELGFYFVQLANYMAPQNEPMESEWAELREAQTMTLSLPETGMAVIIDIGEANDIHPRNKQDVGKRLALAALHETYDKEVVYSGPVYKSLKVEGNTAVVEFDLMNSEMVVKDKYGYVKGFAVAGADKKFYWAKGYQEGNKIYLTSDHVKTPVAVRYAWANNPDDANIYNAAGLPVGPFRTDSWSGITEGR